MTPALNPGQFKQLRMFMTAREITEEVRPGDWNGDWDPDSPGVRSKLRETATGGTENAWSIARYGDPTLAQSLKKHGVRTPIAIYHSKRPGVRESVANGHHRVVFMDKHQPDTLLPVVHRGRGEMLGSMYHSNASRPPLKD